MARFFLQQGAPADQVTLTGDDARHIARALRMRAGEQIELVLGRQAYAARLLSVDVDKVVAEIGECLEDSESPLQIHLYQALPKGDKMDLIVQKATELGVHEITPVLSERVVVKPREMVGAQRLARWQRIAAEAAKQSRRNLIPTLCEPLALADLPMAAGRLRLVAWEDAVRPLAALLSEQSSRSVDLLIGPEGGLTGDEVAVLSCLGFQSVSLGPRILRTETAPLVMISILQYQLGDIGGKRTCPG